MAHPVHVGQMCIHSSVSPFSCHSVLICLFILLPVFLSVCVCLFFYNLCPYFLCLFCFCNFFRSYFSSSVNSSTSPSFYPFLGLFVLMAVRSPTSVGLYMYLFFCRPSFYCRSVIFLVQLSFSLSARQSVCSF